MPETPENNEAPEIEENPGEVIDDSDFISLLNLLNSERTRRGNARISINTTDNLGRVESIDYNTLVSGYNSMTGSKPISSLPTKSSGTIIQAEDINRLRNAINSASGVCLCDCNYACTCDCNYCTCDCNYCTCDCDYCTCDCDYIACPCDCNYCTCDCNHCTCDCNYSCTCDCDYACTCDCDYACTCDCDYACTCNCDYACTCDCDYCTCDCNYCTCDCNYCTCDCDYACTCDCNYS